MTNSNCKAVILGAGKPFSGEAHVGLRRIGGRGAVLEWMLHALHAKTAHIQFVGGYRIDDVAAVYPGLTYVLNPDWEKGGALSSLFCAQFDDNADLIISYGDLVYWPDAMEKLFVQDDAVIIAIDESFPARHIAAGVEPATSTEKYKDAEFIGLIRIPAAFMPALIKLQQTHSGKVGKAHLSKLVDLLTAHKVPLRTVNLAGQWSDLNSAMALTRFVMGTKAQTLGRLEGRLKAAKVCPQVCLRRREFENNADAVVQRVQKTFAGQPLAVRSSALSEDSFLSANAGVFHSVLNVLCEPQPLKNAIQNVIDSFPKDDLDHQIFIQPMVKKVTAGGVAMTRMMQTGAPYYCINYTETDKTDAVTAGSSEDDRILIAARQSDQLPDKSPLWTKQLIEALRELEFLLDYDALDVEFAVSEKSDIYILQVRPIVLAETPAQDTDAVIVNLQRKAQQIFSQLQASAMCAGKRTAFGVMPDWNPAEIIGTRPAVLASDLYTDLIMNDVWAQQRQQYGYRNVRPQPLMRHFAGQPYVDIRASLNSFTPAALDDALAGRLVDFYLDWLEDHPQSHDKIEFDVVPTCYSFDFTRWDERFTINKILNAKEIETLKSTLRDVTNNSFTRIDSDWNNIEAALQIHKRLMTQQPGLERALALIDASAQGPTLTFAHLARAAFVAMTLLRSAVATNLITAEQMQGFLLSIETVSSRFAADAFAVKSNNKPFNDFVAEYGHLRPGTYDVTSERYSANPDFYLRSAVTRAELPPTHKYAWTDVQTAALDQAFADHGLNLDTQRLDHFCRRAIEGREYAKFIFTRLLSDAMEDLCTTGAHYGLSRTEVAHLPLTEWRALAAGTLPAIDAAVYLKQQAAANAAHHRISSLVELPPLLFSEHDFMTFILPESHPNFITDARVVTDLKVLDQEKVLPGELSGHIVQIDAADPGYDWLFGQGIAGLITKYGGANSHMAIRAAEFGLPAAIGVGSVRYQTLSRARRVDLNCRNRQIVVVG